MGQTSRLDYPRRGEVFLVRFDPAEGAEIRRTRPALILQNDVGNRFSSLTIVAAIKSRLKGPLYPVQVPLHAPEGGLTVDSVVALNQIRTVDKGRLIRRMGKLVPETMDRIDHALGVSLALVDI
ncbi:MAG: type II toxin-antitoxin system PemK/MazF family toxin [Candidatus Hydrogenedentes bacterium]|nr:type II toxin-antitoxin system PemK/MazF family toxin [Candidatus Hydrogenedentota bacterium]